MQILGGMSTVTIESTLILWSPHVQERLDSVIDEVLACKRKQQATFPDISLRCTTFFLT